MVLPHIGLASISSHLQDRGIRSATVDAWAERLDLDRTVQRILATEAPIVGFSANTYQVIDTGEVAKSVKDARPSVTTLIGGYHANALPEQTLRDFPAFDYLVFGEGEETVAELIERRGRDEGWEGVAGLAWRAADGRVRRGPARSLLPAERLPSLRYDGLPIGRYRPMYALPWERRRVELPVYTARGCPYNCSFCSNLFREVRCRPLDAVLEEIRSHRRRFGMERILFTDENLPIRRERVARLCEALLREGFSPTMIWCCQSRVDSVDEGLLRLMRRAGCMAIVYGIESGNQAVLDGTGKKIRLDQAREAVAATRAAGILADAQFILGLPHDTPETIRQTVRFAFELDPDLATFAILTPFPGSPILEMARRGEGGLELLTEDWRLFGKQIGGALALAGMERGAIEKVQFRAYLRFFLRPRKIPGLLRVASPLGILAYFVHVAVGWAKGRARPARS